MGAWGFGINRFNVGGLWFREFRVLGLTGLRLGVYGLGINRFKVGESWFRV